MSCLRCRHLCQKNVTQVLPAVNVVRASCCLTLRVTHSFPNLRTSAPLNLRCDELRKQLLSFAGSVARICDQATSTAKAVQRALCYVWTCPDFPRKHALKLLSPTAEEVSQARETPLLDAAHHKLRRAALRAVSCPQYHILQCSIFSRLYLQVGCQRPIAQLRRLVKPNGAQAMRRCYPTGCERLCTSRRHQQVRCGEHPGVSSTRVTHLFYESKLKAASLHRLVLGRCRWVQPRSSPLDNRHNRHPNSGGRD